MSLPSLTAAMSAIKCRIDNIIKTAFISKVTDDSSAYPSVQVGFKEKIANVTRLSPYGLDSNPPSGSFVLIMNAYGQESNKFAICSDALNRLKNLEEGEVAVYNTLTQSHVILKSNGDINIQANGDINITATGDVHIQGVDWLTHKHSGVEPGEGISGPVVQL